MISSRAESLARFIESYSKLARLPQPRFEPHIGDLVRRVATLETASRSPLLRAQIIVRDFAVEQLLINPIRNAVDAACETAGRESAGPAERPCNRQCKTEGPGLATCQPFRSLLPSGQESVWCFRGRLPKLTAAPLLWKIVWVSGCEAAFEIASVRADYVTQPGPSRN